MPWTDCHAVHQQLADLLNDGSCEVLASRRRAGEYQYQVRLALYRLAYGYAKSLRIVRHYRRDLGLPSNFLNLCTQYETVVLDKLSMRRPLPNWNQFISSRDNGHARLAANHHRIVTTPSQRPQVYRTNFVVRRQHQLGCHHVLPHWADVLPGGNRRANLDVFFIGLLHFLNHNNGVGIRRQWVARVNRISLRAQLERDWACFRRVDGFLRQYCKAIHSGGVVMR